MSSSARTTRARSAMAETDWPERIVVANLRNNSTALLTARRDPASLRKQRALPWPSATAMTAVSPSGEAQYSMASWFGSPERTCELPLQVAPATRHRICCQVSSRDSDDRTTAGPALAEDSIFVKAANLRAASGTARVLSHSGILNGTSAVHSCSSGKR